METIIWIIFLLILTLIMLLFANFLALVIFKLSNKYDSINKYNGENKVDLSDEVNSFEDNDSPIKYE